METPLLSIDAEIRRLLYLYQIDQAWFLDAVSAYTAYCGEDFAAISKQQQLAYANTFFFRMQTALSADMLWRLGARDDGEYTLTAKIEQSDLTVVELHDAIYRRLTQILPRFPRDELDQLNLTWNPVFVSIIDDILSERSVASTMPLARDPNCAAPAAQPEPPSEPQEQHEKSRPVRVAQK